GRDREAGPALGDLASIVKAYDIRGVVPDQLDEGVAEAGGAGVARGARAGANRATRDMGTSPGPPAGGRRPRAGGHGAAGRGAGPLGGPTCGPGAWPRPTCSTTPAVTSASPAR